jgi:hypothetical protein
MDKSTKLPAQGPGVAPRLVVATLDVNIGRTLPAEELVGQQPQVGARPSKLLAVAAQGAAKRTDSMAGC